jgi:hypothetical protein
VLPIIGNKRVPSNSSLRQLVGLWLLKNQGLLEQIEPQNKFNKNMKEEVKQRKKDKHDAIVYPPYFVRNGGLSSDVRIDAYTKKVLNNTSWK